MRVCIYGASSSKIDDDFKQKCFVLGKKLAERGHSLVFGAGSEGLMGASVEGFKAGGGHVHGVIPHFFRENGYEAIYENCDKITYTETMAERKAIMEDECNAFIIVPGGIGTFEEFFQVLTLKQLGRHEKPIVMFNVNGYYDNLNKFFEECVQKEFISDECKKLYVIFNNDDELIKYLEEFKGEDIEWSILKKND